MLLDSFDREIGIVSEVIHLGGLYGSRLHDSRIGSRCGRRLNNAFADGCKVGANRAGLLFLDCGTHLIDDFVVTFLLFFGNEMIKPVGTRAIEHVGSVVGFGVEFIAHGRAGIFDGITFGIDNGGQK